MSSSINGSYSIKYVLPALLPDMAQVHKDLSYVQNGANAMGAFARLQTSDIRQRGARSVAQRAI